MYLTEVLVTYIVFHYMHTVLNNSKIFYLGRILRKGLKYFSTAKKGNAICIQVFLTSEIHI